MNGVVAHPSSSVRRSIAAALTGIGWAVSACGSADEAETACRERSVDVLFVEAELCRSAGLLERMKGDSVLYRTAIVLVGEHFEVPEVLEALEAGVDDTLRTPADDAEVVSRAFAAARRTALVEELTLRNKRYEELAFTDELTGLYNRRFTLHELDMLLAAARRHGHALSVLLLDVDRFKGINDSLGHAAGDEVLREVARRLNQRLRTEDVAGRLGGDELLLVLPDTDAGGAWALADGVRESVAAAPVLTSAGEVRVRISIGSATWRGEAAKDLINRADQALYAAKASGRDRAAAA